MRLPFFASFVVFCLVVGHQIRRSRRMAEKREKNYWEYEAAANQVRRQPIDQLPYIQIPLDSLPLGLPQDQPQAEELAQLLKDLSGQKILNLTGQTNTDLKYRYGAANLPFLTQCDENYTLLARSLDRWAALLEKAGLMPQMALVLEFALSTGSDISASYLRLARYYQAQGEREKIEILARQAQELPSLSKDSICAQLKKFLA